MTQDPDQQRGLYPKYRLYKYHPVDGRLVLVSDDFFVIRPSRDPSAKDALVAYAQSVRDRGFIRLSDDLRKWLSDLRAPVAPYDPDDDSTIGEVPGDMWTEGTPSSMVEDARAVTEASNSQELVADARRALMALRLEAPAVIMDDVSARVEAAFTALGANPANGAFADPATDARAVDPPEATPAFSWELGDSALCETCMRVITLHRRPGALRSTYWRHGVGHEGITHEAKPAGRPLTGD